MELTARSHPTWFRTLSRISQYHVNVPFLMPFGW
jgi:hypothetical protein